MSYFPFYSDSGDIYTRLFDHRPFLNGEIQHFIREFEVSHQNYLFIFTFEYLNVQEKRGTKDIEGLLKSREKLTDLKDLLDTSIGESTKEQVTDLVESIIKASRLLEEVASPKSPEVELVFKLISQQTIYLNQLIMELYLPT